MASPITWRNINAPNFSDSNRLALGAGQQVSQGISQIGDAIDGYQQKVENRELEAKNATTDGFLRRVNSFNDLDNYGAFRDTINRELDNLAPGQVDYGKVQTALQGRDNALRTDITERSTFNDTPLMSQLTGQLTEGNFDGANQTISQLSGRGRAAGQAQLVEAQKKADLERQRNSIASEIPAYIAQNYTSKTAAINALPEIVDKFDITDSALQESIDAGKLFTDATSTTQRQDKITANNLEKMTADFQARRQTVENDFNSKHQAPKDYEAFYDVDLQGMSYQEFVRANYEQQLAQDPDLKDDSTFNRGMKWLLNTTDSTLSEDIDFVEKYAFGATTPSNISQEEKKLHNELKDYVKEYKDTGGIPDYIREAAKRNAAIQSLGSSSGDLNDGPVFRNNYLNALIKAIKLDKENNAYQAARTELNSTLAMMDAKFVDETNAFKNSQANQNVSALRAAGKT